jgi:hypothetical protein
MWRFQKRVQRVSRPPLVIEEPQLVAQMEAKHVLRLGCERDVVQPPAVDFLVEKLLNRTRQMMAQVRIDHGRL